MKSELIGKEGAEREREREGVSERKSEKARGEEKRGKKKSLARGGVPIFSLGREFESFRVLFRVCHPPRRRKTERSFAPYANREEARAKKREDGKRKRGRNSNVADDARPAAWPDLKASIPSILVAALAALSSPRLSPLLAHCRRRIQALSIKLVETANARQQDARVLKGQR